MSDTFTIKNFNKVNDVRFEREPLYASEGGSLTSGTLAQKLGASVDTLPPGKRSTPFHFHHVQEEMFIILKGNGTLRIAERMVAIEEGGRYHYSARKSVAASDYQHLLPAADVHVCQHHGVARSV